MKYFKAKSTGSTLIGLAYGPVALNTFKANEDIVDYIEVPFEQLHHDQGAGEFQKLVPAILHCASMSVAGFVPPLENTLLEIAQEAVRTGTPWIGEHLAYISADRISAAPGSQDSPTMLSYTVCPQLSEQTIQRTSKNLAFLRERFSVPIIVENSPQYFNIPGSEMSMIDFIIEV